MSTDSRRERKRKREDATQRSKFAARSAARVESRRLTRPGLRSTPALFLPNEATTCPHSQGSILAVQSPESSKQASSQPANHAWATICHSINHDQHWNCVAQHADHQQKQHQHQQEQH